MCSSAHEMVNQFKLPNNFQQWIVLRDVVKRLIGCTGASRAHQSMTRQQQNRISSTNLSVHPFNHPPTHQPADSSAMYSMLLSEAPTATAARHSSHSQATAPPMHHSLAPLSQSVQNIPAFNEPPKLVQQHSTEKRKFHWFAYIIIWMHFLQPNFCDWTMNKFKFIIAVQSTTETTLDHFNSFSLS